MIELKTAVFLAGSLQMGAMVAGASEADQQHIYAFGKNLGLAFQVQDDYLDSFGNPERFGKQKGGDILANKKTFLLVKALEKSSPSEKETILNLLKEGATEKVERMLEVFKVAGVDEDAKTAKNDYMETAYAHLDSIAVPSSNKNPLRELAGYLLEREV